MTGPGRLTRISPIFPVRDLGQALAHYRSLGFVTTTYDDRYGFADRDGVGLHLAVEADHDPGAGAAEAYLYVEDADAIYAEWSGPGLAGITRPVHDTPYRLREGAHIDPDGNVIRFGSFLRSGPVPDLEPHLASQYGIEVTRVSELDTDVLRVDRRHGPSWVARLFPPSRSPAAVAGDGEILGFLAEHGYPAERNAADEPVSDFDGRGLLVTEYVDPVPRAQRRAAVRQAGGLRLLGQLLGRLHTLPEGTGAVARHGGAWHHLAEGGPADELAAVSRLLTDTERRAPVEERPRYEALHAELRTLDDGRGLPRALTHPDFVLANVVASPDGGLVVVDWTGAGRGPRPWSLAFLLFVEGAKDLRRVDLVVDGYRRHVDLEPEELARLAAMVRARPIVLRLWELCTGRRGLADTAREVAAAVQLGDVIAERARAAFAAR